MEDDPKKTKKGKRPKKNKKKSTEINLIGCDTIVNSPSYESSLFVCPSQGDN